MILGIVGSEASKFTPDTEYWARQLIRAELANWKVDMVISGACHLGGIDIWAIEEAKAMGIATHEFPPAKLKWEGGYKQRNMQIAFHSDEVICITVRELPPGYEGMRFRLCYHCKTPPDHHVKSGGCWTTKYARTLGKPTKLLVVE